MKIKTQRAMAMYDAEGALIDAESTEVFEESPGFHDTPVLVVPESAVKGCKHKDEIVGDGYCPDCGAHRRWSDSAWQRPRILRVGRVKK